MALTKSALDLIAGELRANLESAPTGGTERERQAWRNGFVDAVAAVAEAAHKEMGLDANGNRRFKLDRFLRAVGVERRIVA